MFTNIMEVYLVLLLSHYQSMVTSIFHYSLLLKANTNCYRKKVFKLLQHWINEELLAKDLLARMKQCNALPDYYYRV